MRLLLTNDDGIDAPGLQALVTAAASLGEVVVVAPAEAQSGCGHRVTTQAPIRVTQHRPGWFAVTGTPADCVRVALHHLVPDAAWVLAGINHGGNLGVDVYHSGTVAAVREAVLHQRPGIAVSQYQKRGQPVDWSSAAAWTTPLLARLLTSTWQAGTFWNVNLPHLENGAAEPEAVECDLELSPLPLSFRPAEDGLLYDGNYHQRQRASGSDVDVCFNGRIALTRLRLG